PQGLALRQAVGAPEGCSVERPGQPQRAFETRPMDALARIRHLRHPGKIDQTRKASRPQRPLAMARAKRRLAKTISRIWRKNRDRGRVRFFPEEFGRGHWKHAEGLDR